jgi:hypothetical protein
MNRFGANRLISEPICGRIRVNDGPAVVCYLHMGGRRLAAEKKKAALSDAHHAALADGRDQGRAVRRYLEGLEAHKPKRGRRRTPEGIKKRLAKIDAEIAEADPLKRLQLVQERIDLEGELARATDKVDLSELEAAFVKAAGPYSERKGITYAAWRELGVSAATLKAAGITRAGG